MEVQIPVRQCLSPGHRGEDAADRTHERPGSYEHDDKWLHDHVLQVCNPNVTYLHIPYSNPGTDSGLSRP